MTLDDGAVSTVPYDDGHLYTYLWGAKYPAAHATPAPAAGRVLAKLRRDADGPVRANASAAAAACAARGAALCPPSALRSDGIAGSCAHINH